MAQEHQRSDLTASSATIPSDSENYSSSQNELSPSPPSSSTSPMILYSPPTIWGLLRGAAINILLPFVNGLMLGFGELLAHEAAFRLGWSGTKVCSYIFPTWVAKMVDRWLGELLLMGSLAPCDLVSLLGPELCCAVLKIDRFEQIFPSGRSSRSVGPGIEIREDPSETMRRERELDDMTSLE